MKDRFVNGKTTNFDFPPTLFKPSRTFQLSELFWDLTPGNLDSVGCCHDLLIGPVRSIWDLAGLASSSLKRQFLFWFFSIELHRKGLTILLQENKYRPLSFCYSYLIKAGNIHWKWPYRATYCYIPLPLHFGNLPVS
jgi:hypothetical protein